MEINSQIDHSNQQQKDSTNQSMQGLLELKNQISTLQQAVPQLKNYLEHNSAALDQLNRDTEMVKESVGY
jgi:methyl-accepting chemotaxis protein